MDKIRSGGATSFEADAQRVLEFLLPHLNVARGPDRRGEYFVWCPLHQDGKGKPPHSPNLNVSIRGWFCHVCNRGGPLSELAKLLGLEIPSKRANDIVTAYDYHDEHGVLLYQVIRRYPKKFQQRCPDGKGGWTYSLKGRRRVLYRLQELINRSADRVWIVEGEKDVDRLMSVGLLATTNAMGAKKWRGEYSEYLRGRDVLVVPDNDESGEEHALRVATSLTGVAAIVRVVRLPDLPEKGDVSDWLSAGHSPEELNSIADSSPVFNPEARANVLGTDDPPKTKPRSRRSQADVMIDLARDGGVELHKDSQGEPVCFLPVGGHREVWPCSARHVKAWLTRAFNASEGRVPNLTALKTAINGLDAHARLEGEAVELHNRVAGDASEIWIDLSSPDWSAVRVTPDGWEIDGNPAPAFRRYKHQSLQVSPQRCGSLDRLLRFINVAEPHNRLLLKVYLVSTLVPGIPHPICIVFGPQGSSKSTLCRMMRKLCDPSLSPLMSLPHEPDRLYQTLDHHWMPTFDNVSGFPRWTSDAFCRAATGDGITKRALFTDDDDFIFTYKRCVVLNGINISAVQPDLLDRALLIGLAPITTKTRGSEEELWSEFEVECPLLFGAMLDALSKAMAGRDRHFTSDLPRMADFAQWGMAIAEALGYSSREFLEAYDANVSRQSEEAVNAHPVALTLTEFITRLDQWEGSPSELLGVLTEEAARFRIDTHEKNWPKQPNHLSQILNELSPSLEATGVTITPSRSGRKGRRLMVRKGSAMEESRL